jgi:hypothetical protein
LTDRPPARRLTLAVTVLLSLGVLVAALIGPAQGLAQTRKPACSSSAHAKAKHATRACTRPSHKRKAKSHAKHMTTKKTSKGSPTPPATVAAVCEDGSAPVRTSAGSFSCSDGSEPACESGATPTTSRSGKSLLCPVLTESEPGSTEAECEEEGLECTGVSSGSGEQGCEASASDSSSFVCEAES